MPKFILVAIAGLVAVVGAAKVPLKCGGPIGKSSIDVQGKKSWDLLKTWVNKNSKTFTMTIDWKTNIEADIKALTDCTTGASCVDVLIPPYGSSNVISLIDHINPAWEGVVMVWGGASDTIFTKCAGKKFKCFGTFTVGSQYMTSGLAGLNAKSSTDLKVMLIDNDKDAFAKSVCKGAKDYIAAQAGLTLAKHKTFPNGIALTKAEKTDMDTLHTTHTPDVYAVCGKTAFVGPIVEHVAAKDPKAILGTNIITSSTIATLTKGFVSNCLLMPTQWAGGADKDSITAYTTATWKTAVGVGNDQYHAASAAASAIAIIHAMETQVGTLAVRMAKVDTVSFYGRIKFTATGTITKPMYTQQRLKAKNQVVLPANSALTETFQPDYKQCKAGKMVKVGVVAGVNTTANTSQSSSGIATARISMVVVAASALFASAW